MRWSLWKKPEQKEEDVDYRLLETAVGWLETIYLGGSGPLSEEPREFAAWWAAETSSDQWMLMLEWVKEPGVYERFPSSHIGIFDCLEALITAGAERNPEATVHMFEGLLNHPVGRRAAFSALEAALRYAGECEGRDAPVAAMVKARLERAVVELEALTDDEKPYLCLVLSHLKPEWAIAFASRIGLDCARL